MSSSSSRASKARPMSSSASAFRLPEFWPTVIISFLIVNLLFAAFLDKAPIFLLQPLYDLSYFVFRSQFNLQMLVVVAYAVHLLEAIWVVSVSNVKGIQGIDLLLWFLQTLALGYPSTKLVHAMPNRRVVDQ